MYYPDKLIDAISIEFSFPVAGFLMDARIKDEGYRGAIFFDVLKRCEDGCSITIGEVVSVMQEHGYSVIQTGCGSRYVIVSHLMFIEESFDGVPQALILRAH
ncbi:hypothetical protein [Pseudomonas sp. ICMP 561]|uniref:hypothetical protein n=1 Tax=Pseudomonas sp. ICMP 561 TaxID=1718918 RepID=UPI00211D708E|nr:hypothetical protein [Pseudomonas sp. ICMP 561]